MYQFKPNEFETSSIGHSKLNSSIKFFSIFSWKNSEKSQNIFKGASILMRMIYLCQPNCRGNFVATGFSNHILMFTNKINHVLFTLLSSDLLLLLLLSKLCQSASRTHVYQTCLLFHSL